MDIERRKKARENGLAMWRGRLNREYLTAEILVVKLRIDSVKKSFCISYAALSHSIYRHICIVTCIYENILLKKKAFHTN